VDRNQIRPVEQRIEQNRDIAEPGQEFGGAPKHRPVQPVKKPQATIATPDGQYGLDLLVTPQGCQVLRSPGVRVGKIPGPGLRRTADPDLKPHAMNELDARPQSLLVADRSSRAEQADNVAPFQGRGQIRLVTHFCHRNSSGR
jgi:hypothetical protein